jgi:uncharacterized membrane protein
LHSTILADGVAMDNRRVPVVDIVALVLGVGIALAVGEMATSVADSPDDSMRWEGGVAVGFAGLIMLGPFLIAQGVLTIIATYSDGGVAPGWLWAWLFVAPAIGASPPVVSLMRVLKRLR